MAEAPSNKYRMGIVDPVKSNLQAILARGGGKLSRFVLDALGASQRPMTVTETVLRSTITWAEPRYRASRIGRRSTRGRGLVALRASCHPAICYSPASFPIKRRRSYPTSTDGGRVGECLDFHTSVTFFRNRPPSSAPRQFPLPFFRCLGRQSMLN